jgi:hypothetical protein
VLRKCLKVGAIRKTLKSLPKTLDETYDRILCGIDELYRDDTYRVLLWLAFSARPVTLAEVAEALAIDVDNYCVLDADERFGDPCDILALCSSLVTASGSGSDPNKDGDRVQVTGMFHV